MTAIDMPPQLAPLIRQLAHYSVRYVIIGSVAAKLYGATLEPGDFDITPALDTENLERLGDMLVSINAKPGGDFGYWKDQQGERKWVSITPSERDLQARINWSPEPEHITSFDTLFYTRFGNLDIVPDLVGDYSYLTQRAVMIKAFETPVWVAHVDDLLATLTVPRRVKDQARVKLLREIQRKSLVEQEG